RAIDVPIDISGHPFRCARGGGLLDRIGDERRDRPVTCTADADAAPPAIVIAGYGFRLGIGHVDSVLLVDVDPAGAAELAPDGELPAVLIENHDPVVAAIANEQPPLGVHGQGVRAIQ